MSNAAPGYYDDGSGTKRWWDGTRWGAPQAPVNTAPANAAPAHTAPGYGAPAYGAPGYYSPLPPRRPVWPWIVGGAGLLLLVIIGVIIAFSVFAASVRGATTGAGSPASVVTNYDQAWETVDCGLYEEITTASAREGNGHSDCADFESDAQDFVDRTDDYVVSVSSSRIDGATAEVRTAESYEQEDDGTDYVDHYLYTLIRSGGRWIIDGVEYLDGPGTGDPGNDPSTNDAEFEAN